LFPILLDGHRISGYIIQLILILQPVFINYLHTCMLLFINISFYVVGKDIKSVICQLQSLQYFS